MTTLFFEEDNREPNSFREEKYLNILTFEDGLGLARTNIPISGTGHHPEIMSNF